MICSFNDTAAVRPQFSVKAFSRLPRFLFKEVAELHIYPRQNLCAAFPHMPK